MKTRYIVTALVSTWALAGQDASRIDFPAGYAQRLHQQGSALHSERSGVTTVYSNEIAAQAAKDGLASFPDGALVVMEFAQSVKDAEGKPLRDREGRLLKGDIEHVDVMQRGPAPGAVAASRAGQWSFASFGPDGKILVAPRDAAACAECHRQGAAERDFVFRKRGW
jgi:hypothetical protein